MKSTLPPAEAAGDPPPTATAPIDRARLFTRLLRRYGHPSVALWRCVEIAAVADFLSKNPVEGPILDLGCGEGHVADLLFDQVDIGLEIETSPLRQAKTLKLYRHLTTGDAQRLPFADDSFETVFSNSVIEHIPRNDDVLREACRVLRPGGKLVFTVPTNPNFGDNLLGTRVFHSLRLPGLATRYHQQRNRLLDHFHTYTPDQWQQRLADADLKLEHCADYLSPAATRWWDFFAMLGWGLRHVGVWGDYERQLQQSEGFGNGCGRILNAILESSIRRQECGGRGSSLLLVASKQ